MDIIWTILGIIAIFAVGIIFGYEARLYAEKCPNRDSKPVEPAKTCNKLTMKDIENALVEIQQKTDQVKYGDAFVLGFSNNCKDDEALVIEDKRIRQHEKKVVLVKPQSRLHEAILKEEKRMGIHIERLDPVNMYLIKAYHFMIMNYEDGEEMVEYGPFYDWDILDPRNTKL